MSNYGAFHSDDSVLCESYSRTYSNDGCSESTERESTSKGGLSSTATTNETCINISKKDSILNPDDILSETRKEFTNEMKKNITSLLNFLYADEFVEDALLLELITMILFASEKSYELQNNNELVNDQNDNAYELQAWIDIMSEKIYGSETETVIARQGRIPGPVGKPVIGGCTMHKWLRNKP